MASPQVTARYSALPRASTDTEEDREMFSQDPLLPTRDRINTNSFPQTYSITFTPSVAIRVLSIIFGLSSFIVFVNHGRDYFIASDVFLMITIVHNFIQIIKVLFTSSFKVSIEYRGRQHNLSGREGSQKKTSLILYLDILWALATFISLASEGGVYFNNHWWSRSSIVGGSVVGYISIGLQVLLVIPNLDKNTITLTARINSPKAAMGSVRPDIKYSVPIAGEEQQSGLVSNETITRSGADMV